MIRLVIVEDHPAIVEGLRALIDDEPDIDVVGSAADVADAERVIARSGPDVVLCDLRLAGGPDGFDLIARVPKGPRFVILSASTAPSHYRRALESGAVGYVSKTAPIEIILNAIRAAASGATAYSPEARLAGRNALRPPTRRELQILERVAEGLTNAQIADLLGLRPKTVESQLRRLFERYDVSSRTRLVRVAEIQGWLEPIDQGTLGG